MFASLAALATLIASASAFSLQWATTSPYGQANGDISLVKNEYGYIVRVQVQGDASSASLNPDVTFADKDTLNITCPVDGLQAALIPIAPSSLLYWVTFVNDSVALPEGSGTWGWSTNDDMYGLSTKNQHKLEHTWGSHFYRQEYDGLDGVYLTLTPYAEPDTKDTFFFIAYNGTEGEC
ncbi:unnamed protein product [Peniophora sp. CBMAI 1063]|nr:unnamed protein product [Peniophora sp. CBMAI 1063]